MPARKRRKVNGLTVVAIATTLLIGMVRTTEAQNEQPRAAAELENAANSASEPTDPPSQPQPTPAEPQPPRAAPQPPDAQPQPPRLTPQPRRVVPQPPATKSQPLGTDSQLPRLQPSTPSRIRPTDLAMSAVPRYRRSRFHLASVPNMYGDTLPPGGQIFAGKGVLFNTLADLPLAGGARRIKVAENNKAIPMDRFFVSYNHFENALDAFYTETAPPTSTTTRVSAPIDRLVFGMEKTFADERWSLDVRLPIMGGFSFSETSPAYSISGGEIGNLHATAKVLLHESDRWATAAGFGVDIPTGSDVHGAAVIHVIEVNNDAVHLMPFVGFVGAPSDNWFCNGFLEVDVPLNGNAVLVGDPFFPVTGVLNEQTVLNLDLAAGRWLYRDPSAPLLTGLAAIVEMHYTTTLNDADLVTAITPQVDYALSNFANRMDVVNATVGIHTEIARHTTLRVGGVFPLTDGTDRLFDTEVQIQLNRYF